MHKCFYKFYSLNILFEPVFFLSLDQLWKQLILSLHEDRVNWISPPMRKQWLG